VRYRIGAVGSRYARSAVVARQPSLTALRAMVGGAAVARTPDEPNLLGRATPIAHRFRSMDDEREPMDHSPRGRTLCLGKHSTSTTSSEGTQQADRPRVNSFTFSLATDPLVALGVVPSRTGRAGVRYWTAVRSIVSAMLVSSTRGVGYRAVHRRDLHVRRSDRGTPRSRS